MTHHQPHHSCAWFCVISSFYIALLYMETLQKDKEGKVNNKEGKGVKVAVEGD